jgi:hypothetical protein
MNLQKLIKMIGKPQVIGPKPVPEPSNKLPPQTHSHPKDRESGKAPFSKENPRHDGRSW